MRWPSIRPRLEIVSPGNKHSQVAIRQLLDRLADCLEQGQHLLVIDLFPPGWHDPDGLHAAYRADTCPTVYFEPLTVGDFLRDMLLFLTPDRYVTGPL